MPGLQIPAVVKIPQDVDKEHNHNVDVSQQFRVDGGVEVSSESAQSDTVTSQDLQAMKQMVHEISHSSELFYEYSPVYMKRFLSVQHMGENTDSYDGPTAPKEIPYYCQDCNSLQTFHGRSSIKTLPSKLQRRRSNIPSESPLVLKGCKHISPKISAKLTPMPFQSDDSLLSRLSQSQTLHRSSPSKLPGKLQRRRRTMPSESPLVLKGREHISPKVIAKLPPMPFQSDDTYSIDSHRANEFLSFC